MAEVQAARIKATREGETIKRSLSASALALMWTYTCLGAWAQDVKIAKSDSQIDARDSGVKLFLRQKIAYGNTQFNDTNLILFLHGATGHPPAISICPTRIIPGPI
jgi:hypothetical protein